MEKQNLYNYLSTVETVLPLMMTTLIAPKEIQDEETSNKTRPINYIGMKTDSNENRVQVNSYIPGTRITDVVNAQKLCIYIYILTILNQSFFMGKMNKLCISIYILTILNKSFFMGKMKVRFKSQRVEIVLKDLNT